MLAYGSDLIKDPPDASRFANLAALQTIEKSGIFKEQKSRSLRSVRAAARRSRPIRC